MQNDGSVFQFHKGTIRTVSLRDNIAESDVISIP